MTVRDNGYGGVLGSKEVLTILVVVMIFIAPAKEIAQIAKLLFLAITVIMGIIVVLENKRNKKVEKGEILW